MEREQKFEMLSVVAYGIHTRMRKHLQRVMDDASTDPDLRQVLGPVYYFYEYFLDSPALLAEATPTPTACAPFLRRLVLERDFLLVPKWGFDGMGTLLKARNPLEHIVSMPTTEKNVKHYWPDKFLTFPDAISKSVVLKMLHRSWRACGIKLLGDGRLPSDTDLNSMSQGLRRETHRQFVSDSNAFLSYRDGSVCMATGFRRSFARDHHKTWTEYYDPEGGNSWLREFCACIYLWLRSPRAAGDRLCEMLACSISSHYMFFGELIIFFPPIPDSNLRKRTYSLFRDALHSAVRELYVPMLTLFENYEAETDFEAALDAGAGGQNQDERWPESLAKERWAPLTGFLEEVGTSGRSSSVGHRWPDPCADEFDPTTVPFLRLLRSLPPQLKAVKEDILTLCDVMRTVQEDDQWTQLWVSGVAASIAKDDWPCRSAEPLPKEVLHKLAADYQKVAGRFLGLLSDLELALVQLWAHRLARVHSSREAVSESLVFSRYLIASPGMVGRIQAAMNIRHDRARRAVKTALVIGGPGSGKDTMARVVQVFSPGYRFGRGAALNMAMLRPKEVAVPLLLGMDARLKFSGQQVAIEGLLRASIDTRPGPLAEGEPQLGGEGRSITQGYTFILDELNSLDIDSQGALLRILENAELQPLGSVIPDEVDFLVVGVMNEDPDLIMKKRTLDRILQETGLFSGLLGEMLYEAIRGQRRLRDDLYFRLARGGEIRIPDLRERVEDIPILAYFFLRGFIKTLPDVHRPEYWDVELRVYDELMDKGNRWDGNTRELQAVCRRLLNVALSERREDDSPALLIRRRHARVALDSIASPPGTGSHG